MSNSKKHSTIKPVLYSLLSFVLAFTLFILSIACIVKLTVFSRDFMLNAMATVDYYSMIRDELKTEFKNLGHASGLSDEFVDSFVDNMDVRKIETEYISSFYNGDNTLVDTIKFKQDLNMAIDEYVIEKGMDPDSLKDENVEYLVDNATSIYVNIISIPFFSTIANFIYKYDTPLTIAIGCMFVFCAVIVCIIIFTNEYKHRRYRYLCYSLITAAICTTFVPTLVFASGYISKVNIGTRSLYNLFVTYFTSFFSSFYVFAGIYAVLAVITFLLFYKKFKKATGHHR